jgi:hypothetical protein
MSSSSSSVASTPVHVRDHSARHRGKRRRISRHVSRPGFSAQEKVMDINFPIAQSLGNNVYSCIQTGNMSTVSSSASANVYASFYVTLSQLDQYASLVAVFDQYRICAVEITFRPRISQESSNSANTGSFATVIDVDDAASLTSFAQAEDYQTCLIGRGFESQVRTFVPHAAVALYTGSFSGYGNVSSPWIDTSSSTVQHYGVKAAWTATDSIYVMDYTTRFYLQFKNVR